MAQLHSCGVLHRDIKPSNFLMHGQQLLLNDFDLACFEHEVVEAVKVGTPRFWSPRADVEIAGWRYSREDDWMGLALTFAEWLGVYGPRAHAGGPPAHMKLCVVQMLLDPGSKVGDAFRQRIQPVWSMISQQVN